MTLPTRRTATDITRADPVTEITQLSQQLSRLFDELGPDLGRASEGFLPMVDMEETDDAFLLDVELPGVKKEDVDIEIAGRRLVITGERKERERVGLLRRRTRSFGRFRFEVVLPDDVDEDKVEASLDDGVLHIRVPKSQGAQRRRIQVT
jgi:HSP20 family protein